MVDTGRTFLHEVACVARHGEVKTWLSGGCSGVAAVWPNLCASIVLLSFIFF
jgi:hypothetical protein